MKNLVHATQGKNTGNLRQVGAVMVVGGGIAGIQAALDLADQGFKVFLTEVKSAIGGHMAQLDKTFPTNDCAMCSISPKLVATGRHLNIDILTDTDILAVTGEAGNFSVRLRQRPRFIDPTKCIGCGDCAKVCPVSLIDLYEEGLKKRKAVYRLYTQAVPTAFVIEKRGTAPCRDACPAGQRAQGYIALIAEGRYREAFRVIKEDNPFPSVCGRTCHHPCEGHCSRAMLDDPVNIMGLKRFVMDYALAYGREKVEPASRTHPEWIAVVGAGPAGLTAAHDLVKLGYGVTVYEALPVSGGMMRVGIPAHRLPKGVLQQDIDDILALGVILKTNTPIKDPTTLLDQGYNAVCVATGISSSDQTLGIEGEDTGGVFSAATFLRKINLGEPISIGSRVLVNGGGITALDAAAVARRLGADEVFLAIDRPRGELPAYQWETAAVEAEGIHLLENTTAVRITSKNNHVCAVELAHTTRGMETDKSGRRRPMIKTGSEFTIEVDTVIATVGQLSDLCYLDPHFEDLSINRQTLASEHPGIFVVGGRKTGASYIIEAVSLGHRVANSIHNFLQGLPLEQPNRSQQPVAKFTKEELAQKKSCNEINLQPRVDAALLPMQERVTSFREVVLGLTEHQARTEAQRCLQCGVCSECLACVYACGVEAIDHDMIEQEREINVGAIILAPGYQVYNSALSAEYGFGRYPNVVTSLQFERLLSASGPTAGHILRPSDNAEPQRIAFLQCVGSRDQSHDYCSAVCCMYATKEAVMAKEHHPEVDIHVFMMDMRAFSKGYWRYYQGAKNQYGIEYHRCRISTLYEDPQTRDLLLEYQGETGERIHERFDMVVLSVGMEISPEVQSLGHGLGIELDQYGFCHTAQFNPIETSRPGIFAIGPFREPKDIPESVIEASAASAASASLLSNARWSLTTEYEYPPERQTAHEQPRIGVFVCHCGSNIGGFLDVPAVTEYARRLPDVVYSENYLYTCSQDSIQAITKKIQEHDLNRVVIASCSPLTHGPLFQDSLRAAGLNPYLFEMANIRNQCSWVHSHDWDAATAKAKDLVRMAVARAALLQPQYKIDAKVTQVALVVGGGAAGMTAALSLAAQGFPVHLVEKDAETGGNLKHVSTLLEYENQHQNPREILNNLQGQITANKLINLYLESEVIKTKGFLGNFVSTIQHRDGTCEEIKHGVTILATGGQEYRGSEYGYGSDPRIITQQEFEGWYAKQTGRVEQLKSVAMILCVGPAENYCSRICCTVAIKNALAIKYLNPDAQITLFYKDIRTYGFKEKLYARARQQGILFVRYDDQHPIQISCGEDLSIQTIDLNLLRPVLVHPDLVVLAMPIVPRPDVKQVSTLFKAPVDEHGFFIEAHVKLRPVDFATNGLFMAGLAHYPKLLDESMIQAQAAASRAARLLSKDFLTAGGQVAVVDESRCTACLTCVRICPFGVPQIQINRTGVGNILGAAFIEPSICQGCGSCVSECPAHAIELNHYTDAQMMAKISSLIHPESIVEWAANLGD